MPTRIRTWLREQFFHPTTGEALNHKGQALTPEGAEIHDPTPIAPPIGYIKQPPLHQLIREMVRSEHLRQAADAMDQGSFEEEDDFEIDDEVDPESPWEENFDPLKGFVEPPSSESQGAPQSGEAGSPGKAPENAPAPKPADQ